MGKKPRLMLLDQADWRRCRRYRAMADLLSQKGNPGLAVACDCRSGRGVKNLLPAVREVLAEKIAVWNEREW